MDRHIIHSFDNELQNLQNMMMEMARLCETQLHTVNKYLRQEDSVNTLKDIPNIDQRINRYHIDINNECMRLIAIRSPVAIDLRFISSVDRIATDLERIGDECCKIARFLSSDNMNTSNNIWREINPTARLAKQLLSRTINTLARADSKEAEMLIKDDKEIDENYNDTVRLIISYMLENPSTISQGINSLMASKALERIGDHCINIAEAVIFAQKGEDIRYRSIRDNLYTS